MQKNFLIRRSGKGTAAVIGCAALLLLLCASEVLRNGDNTVFDVLSDSRDSMYKQLDTRSDSSEKAVETTQKMNFDFEDNANFSVLSPSFSDHALSVSASEISEIREIAVYDTRAGQVRVLPLEEYVVGALVAEMPQSFEKQALMAQAVACRTFAVRRLCGTTSTKTPRYAPIIAAVKAFGMRRRWNSTFRRRGRRWRRRAALLRFMTVSRFWRHIMRQVWDTRVQAPRFGAVSLRILCRWQRWRVGKVRLKLRLFRQRHSHQL